ncbi:hypothetical protein A2U01_0102483 [Trifolium medium]|uniref:Uncharacterized protein n=1 Tax=Trifolium medium TaxID=97028 RepID=A0A392V452_9FABA|nr:hypothetical protein [Trifolium medium]
MLMSGLSTTAFGNVHDMAISTKVLNNGNGNGRGRVKVFVISAVTGAALQIAVVAV